MIDTLMHPEDKGYYSKVECDAFGLKISIDTNQPLNEAGRNLSYRIIESISKRVMIETQLLDKSIKETKPKLLNSTFKFNEISVQITDFTINLKSFQVDEGSINVKAIFTLATIVAIYNGISQYPSFKEGLNEIFSDVRRAVRYVSEQRPENLSLSRIPTQELEEPIEGINYEVIINSDDVEKRFINRAAIALNIKNK